MFKDIKEYVGKFPAYEVIQITQAGAEYVKLPFTWGIFERLDLAVSMIYRVVDHFDAVNIDVSKVKETKSLYNVVVETETYGEEDSLIDTELYIIKVHHGKSTNS